MAQIRITEPTRGEMRMLFEHALNTAKTDGARQSFGAIAAWHELRWKAMDELAAAEAQKKADEAAAKATHKAPPPAVVTHGIDSPEAQAKRDERRATRLANEAKRQAGKAKAKAVQKEVEQATGGDQKAGKAGYAMAT